MKKVKLATFGGGCFWGVEDVYQKQEGVIDAVSGYMGGGSESVTYEEVGGGKTGHAEVVQLVFDPETISYEGLLDIFWKIHDPTQVNKQGPDVGSQYRSVIFVHSKEQRAVAEASLEKAKREHDDQIATQIEDSSTFHRAEDYHQNYVARTGRGACHVVL